MNSEERLTKIDNTLNSLVEHHARHAEEMAELRSMQKVMILAIERTVEMQQASAKRFDEELKQMRKEFDVGMTQLREAQQMTQEKLHALIDTVDRIIRNQTGGQA